MSEIEGWWSLGDRAAVQREWSQLASNSIAIRRQHRGVVQSRYSAVFVQDEARYFRGTISKDDRFRDQIVGIASRVRAVKRRSTIRLLPCVWTYYGGYGLVRMPLSRFLEIRFIYSNSICLL